MKVQGLRLLMLSITVLFASTAMAQEFEYIGAKKCKKCHLKQYKSWEKTTMAQTFEALKPGNSLEAKAEHGLDPDKDYTTDTECVACHVTGYGKPGGFVDFETTPELANVGCEECHGPGGTFTQDGYMTLDNKHYKKADIVAVGLFAEVTAEQCVSCHSAANPFVGDDFVFDWETNRDEGTHQHYPLKYEH